MVVDFDGILEEVGEFGRYQKLVVYLLSAPSCFMNAFSFAFVFLGYTPDFFCVPPNSTLNSQTFDFINSLNDSSSLNNCDYVSPGLANISHHQCTDFVYDQSYFKSTVVTEWDLVCDQSIFPKTMMSVHSLITLVGCLLISQFQDLWGRKKAFFIVITANLIGNISSLFATEFLVYAILRSFAAFSMTSTWNVSYIWALEYVGPTKRSEVTMILCVLYGFAAMYVGLLAYLCDSWRKLTLVGSVPYLLLYSYFFFLDESPRWLLSRGRHEEAVRTVRKIAKWDKKILKEETVRKLMPEGKMNDLEQETALNGKVHTDESATDKKSAKAKSNHQTPTPRIVDLFKTRNLRYKTCLITYCWAANLLTYLAIAYNMENLKGNLYLSYTLQASVEIPASVFIGVLLERFGRISPLCVSMISCGALLFVAVPIDSFNSHPWVIVSLTLAAKLGITLSFGILVQLASESYPTQLRGLGTGFSSFVGTLGSTVMPYVVHSAKIYKMLPMILMGTTTITSGLTMMMLPDTLGRYMPETIEEAEKGESVGLAAMKENWRKMRSYCCNKKYSGVRTCENENGTLDGVNNEI